MYDSNISDEEWKLIRYFFDPVDAGGGANSKHAKRDVVKEWG